MPNFVSGIGMPWMADAATICKSSHQRASISKLHNARAICRRFVQTRAMSRVFPANPVGGDSASNLAQADGIWLAIRQVLHFQYLAGSIWNKNVVFEAIFYSRLRVARLFEAFSDSDRSPY
jgi:hypothetical protein